MADNEKIMLLVTFAERGMGTKLAKLYAKQGITCEFQCRGRGTASSDLLDILGVGSTEKDILIAYAAGKNAERLLYMLEHELEGAAHGKGIVFTLPVTGLNNLITTVLLDENENRVGGYQMEGKTDNSLILITVNQGHTDAVMDSARQAGARGGTVIRSRWAGEEQDSKFYGISVQTEKEIIAIVAGTEKRNAIMEMVNKKHGLKTEAGAIVCSLGIDRMAHLS